MRTALNVFLFAVCGVLSVWSGTVSNAQIRIEESDREVRVFRTGSSRPFASWTKSDGCDLRVRLQGDSPFAFVDLRPKSVGAPHKLGTVRLPSIRIDGFSRPPVTLRSDGLKPVDWVLPSCGTIAVAEPFTRKGVVFGWIANLNACGAFATTNAVGGVCVTPLADFGPMPSDAAVAEPDTFAVGAFDDCRLGLEAYADAAAERFGIKLPPNRTGYCTWCSDRYGYSDRTVFARGCGAGSERSTREYAAAAERLLKPYGFEFVQFDDQWQHGKELNGPARDFTRTDPRGPYPDGFRPLVAHLNGKGFAAGLWFLPFGGVAADPFWAGQGDVYVKSAVEIATRTPGGAFERPIALPRKAGDPIRTIWGGECLDMTNPKARAILADEVRRFTHEWGFRYLKCDGIFTGFGGDIYGGFGWRDVNFANAVFQDRNASNVQAFRRGFETIRRAAAPGTFILGCNLATIRAMVPSFGLVDGMRTGCDNGPIDLFPKRYLEGPRAGSWRYFLNGRVFWCDPDSTYVRAATPLGRARSMASWTALTDSLYELGDWLPDLPEERVEILRRTMAHHGSRNVRPIDLFENDLPNAWILDGGAHKVVGVFNWNTNAALKVEYPFAFAGLDPAKAYVGWDFWRNEPIQPFSGTFRIEVPADDCRVIALAEVRKGEKVLVSTSRHVASPVFDELNPRAAAVPGETTVRRFYSAERGFEVETSPAASVAAFRAPVAEPKEAVPAELPVTTNRVTVTAGGVVADGKTDQSAALQKLVDGAPDGTEFVFPAGRYFLRRHVAVKERRDLRFRGEPGAVLVLRFTPWGPVAENNSAFSCVGSARLSFERFDVTTDNPPNASGEVVAKDPARGTYDVRIYDEFPITGWEHFFGVDTFDDEGTPDYVIDSYDKVTTAQVPDGKGGTRTKYTGAKYEVIGPQLVRVTAPGGPRFAFDRMRIGHHVLMRYIIYGATVFSFGGCREVTLRDIEIGRCASFGATVSPPSANFTFERFNMRTPKGSRAFYCANADGIHVLGLSGSFVMKDCHFDGLGDDTLNVHGKAGEVKSFDPKTGEAELICRNTARKETKLPWGWANAGDRLVAYDARTCLTKGLVDVVAYENGKGRLKPGSVDLKVGDMLANDRDFPAVLISGCSLRHTRARGILLQSRDMVIENCRFQGLSLPGLLIAPDLRFWNEVGPTVNTEIRNCTFEKCAVVRSWMNRGALTVKNGHGQLVDADPPGIHRDIRVIGNRFVGCGNCGIFISSADGVKIRDNVFENCSASRYDEKDERTLHDIWLNNCAHVELGPNVSDKPSDRLLFESRSGK